MQSNILRFNSELASQMQEQFCSKNELPHFAPSHFCFHCGRDIYSEVIHKAFNGTILGSTGITVSEASNQLITGCPHCHYSFCD